MYTHVGYVYDDVVVDDDVDLHCSAAADDDHYDIMHHRISYYCDYNYDYNV